MKLIFFSCLSVSCGLCCSKKHFVMNPFVKALYKYICLDLWSWNVTTATKANEPILCQLKCHSENFSHHKSSVSWGEITDQKWKCHCGISSQLTGSSIHLSTWLFNTQYILENPPHIEMACLFFFFFLKFRVCWQYGVIVKLCNRLYNSFLKILISGTKYLKWPFRKIGECLLECHPSVVPLSTSFLFSF